MRDAIALDDLLAGFTPPQPYTMAADIVGWLGRCEVRWQETDNPASTKEALVLALRPQFNRQMPKPRGVVPEGSA
ncbi:hypothetical protein ACH4OY_01940 [Micromonospora rubida]|uniref:Uncharacterized protein n=1 Tax=Micromonospora rubida TaxID=2697657 RepID=A0ABW7SE38_9ACTN